MYLNHAGTSYPKAPGVHEAVHQVLRATPETWAQIYQQAHGDVLEEFSTQQGSEWRLLFTSGCTASLALVMQSLPWAAGDRLITSSLEHHALERQAMLLQTRYGVEHHTLSYSSSGPIELTELRGALDEATARGSPAVVAITAASNVTGEQLPLHEIKSMTEAAGAVLLVDAAQTFGTDLFGAAVAAADILVAAGHKWAGGPQGIGILAARQEVRFACPSAVCEVGEQAQGRFLSFCDVGSVNLAGAAGLSAGLRATRGQRFEQGRRMRALANRLRAELQQRDDVVLLGSPRQEHHAVVSFVPRDVELGRIQEQFARREVYIRAGTHCAPSALTAIEAPDGCARVSFGPTNQDADVDAVLACLDACRG